MFNMPSQPLLRVCTLDLVEREDGSSSLQVLTRQAEDGSERVQPGSPVAVEEKSVLSADL
jgi:ATP-dependent Clp protease ATP-binding subunit ClpX